MRIDRFEIISYRLPLRFPWISATGRMHARRGFIVKLFAGGLCGLGDAAPLEEAGTESPSDCLAWLRQQRITGIDVDDAIANLPSPSDCPPAARCGLETALLDLAAQSARLSLAQYLSPGATSAIEANANAGAVNNVQSETLTALAAEGYRVIKLKVGLDAVEAELKQLRALCASLPENIRLRLDANQAWDLSQAETLLKGIAGLPIESVEEPLKPSVPTSELTRLQAGLPFPLALDESLGKSIDMNWLAAKRIVLKPMRLGGLRPCIEVARQARDRGIETVITTTVDSAIGAWAATHLAAAVDQGLAHGLDTGRWLAADIASAPVAKDGLVALPRMAGLGVDCLRILSTRAPSR